MNRNVTLETRRKSTVRGLDLAGLEAVLVREPSQCLRNTMTSVYVRYRSLSLAYPERSYGVNPHPPLKDRNFFENVCLFKNIAAAREREIVNFPLENIKNCTTVSRHLQTIHVC